MTHQPQLSRRDLLRGNFAGRQESRNENAEAQGSTAKPAATASARFQKAFPILRPPGAIEEDAFLAGCTQCNACVEACPHDAISHAPRRYRRAAGTPMIDPVLQPCWMCDDFPCITVCEPNVLRLDLPKKIGLARIDAVNCLPYQGRACSACVEDCPVPGAIVLVGEKPRIVEDICTGCGVCQFVCPAPDNAILLLPLLERPMPPAESSNMPNPDDVPLPEMSDAVLGSQELAALFGDYRACTSAVRIQLKSGPGLVAPHASPTLDEAIELLLTRRVRGVQLRYEFSGSQWCDTLMPVDSGVRLVRVKEGS
ncbi:MAG TPA: 4Fe-4S dicluster domain-containing protein [Chthoniobacteraceae bacterium]|nr:4Fe-4S dicluster domain-containing protein [Chthoniobacteraceae bacterium]